MHSALSKVDQKATESCPMRRKMVVLKVFCSYWVRKGVLSESPLWRVKLSFGRIVQLPRALSESEIGGLLAQARQRHRANEVPQRRRVGKKQDSWTIHSLISDRRGLIRR